MDKRHLPSKKIAIPALRDWPLAGKMMLLVLLPVGIVLATILALTVSGLNRLETDTSASLLEDEVRIISQRFTEEQSNLQISATQLTVDPLFLNAVESNDRAALQSSILSASVRSGFDYIQILDTTGRVIGAVETFDLADASADLAQLKSLGLLEIEAIRFVSTPHGWLLTIVRPIKTQSGLIGVLSAGRLLDTSALANLNFERTNPQLIVFDAQGNINAVSQSETQVNLAEMFITDHNLWSQALTGETVLSHASIQGETRRVAYAPLTIGGRPVAVFGLSLSTAATINLRDRLIITDLLVGGVFGLLAIVSILSLTRTYIGRPIAALVTSAKQVASGNLDIVVPGTTNRDEIGLLAAAFYNMTSQLRQTLERLDHRAVQITTSAEVSRRLSTFLNERQLIIEVTEQLKAAFDYYHVHIYLLDEKSGDLIMAGGTGDVGAAMLGSGHKIPKGKGLVGRVAETSTPVLVSDTSKDPDWLPNPLLPETSSEAAVPIATTNKVLGVLDVQHNKTHGLQQEDVDLLQSLANQVAIALLNARSYTDVQQRADREARVTSIGQKIQSTTTVEGALQVAVRELGRTLSLNEIRVILEAPGGSEANQKPNQVN